MADGSISDNRRRVSLEFLRQNDETQTIYFHKITKINHLYFAWDFLI